MDIDHLRRACMGTVAGSVMLLLPNASRGQRQLDLPRPSFLGESMRPTPWQEYPAEEVIVNVVTDDHAGFFVTRQGPNSGGSFSLADPKVLNGQVSFVNPPPRTFAFLRERWFPVQSFTIIGPNSYERTIETSVGSRREQVEEFNRSLSSEAKMGDSKVGISISAKLSEMTRRTSELTQMRKVIEVVKFSSREGETALYVQWQREEQVQILTAKGQRITWQSLWHYRRAPGGRIENQAIASFVSPMLFNRTEEFRMVKTSFRS